MNAAGDDIPYQEPEHRIALPGVGLNRKNIPVQIQDPFGSGTISHLNCEVETRTFVPAEKRGIHTSRIGRLVAESTERVYPDLQAYASELARAMSDAEYGISSQVSVSGVLSYLEEVKGWKQEKDKVSLEHLGLHARVYSDRGHQVEHAGLSINHITACPCVQQTYKHALLQAKGNVHAALDTVAPLLTHSQRCSTVVEVKNLAMSLPVRRILEGLDEVLYRVQNTLPREHELLLVYRAHAAPQFIEDAVRQILARLYSLLADEAPQSSVRLHSVSMESIHDFDIAAEIELSMAQLQEVLGA
jgi:GTP cyclohydrolase FolE2